MAKYKIDDVLTPSETYYKTGKKLFGNTWKGKEFSLPVKEIVEKDGFEAVYKFADFDKYGNQLAIAEKYLKLV